MTRRLIINSQSGPLGAVRTASLVSIIGVTVVGCAGSYPSVEQARNTVEQLRADPTISSNAAVALQRTEEAFSRLTAAADDGAGRKELDHLAYLVERRAETTVLRAATVQNWQALEALDERRNNALLRAESLEAEVAKQRELAAILEAQEARKQVASLQQELNDVAAKTTDRGLVVTLGDLLFDVDGANLKPGGLAEVRRVAEALADRPARRVEIEGHTDSTGSENYNIQLSDDRAAAVKQALIEAGVMAEQITARGYGESYPVATNETQSGRQQNRRVELIIHES
jgi:outer membrane protein OmpA-like peptidoglycan-associated protein